MTSPRPYLLVASAALAAALLAAACGSEASRAPAGDSSATPSGPTSPGASNGGLGASTPSTACTAGDTRPGCPCSGLGTQAACWTGPAALRAVGACKDGVATCEGQGEFASWSACSGELLPGSQGIDAQCQSTCKGECVPGKVRWCDHPTTCNWAKQECLPNNKGGGSWGQCIETKEVPSACKAFIGGSPFFYDEECCLKSNECCQVGGIDSPKSDGNCAGITTTCP
jgi:hypothetical protein